MAFSRVAALLHAALSDVSTAQHHTATVAGDLNLVDMAERDHVSLQNITRFDHVADATQADMEGETSTGRNLRPDRVRHAPGVAKVWVKWEQTGAHSVLASYNYTSATDGSAAGDTDHLYDDDFSTAEYCLIGGGDAIGGVNNVVSPNAGTQLAGGVTTFTENTNNSNLDSDENSMVIFGDQ